MKTYRGSLIVLIVILGLGAYAYFFEYRESVIKEENRARQARLMPLEASEITRLGVTSGEREYLLLKSDKDDRSWVLIAAGKERKADLTQVELLIEQLIEQNYLAEVAKGEDVNWGLFGLDKPKAKIEVTTRSGESHTVSVSGKSNFEGKVYLRRGDEESVVLGAREWGEIAGRESFHYRDKKLLQLSTNDLEKVRVTKPEGSFQLVKGDGEWMSPAHEDWKLDQAKIEDFLSELQSAEATAVALEEDPSEAEQKRFGFAKAPWKIELESKKGETWAGQLGQGSGNTYFFWPSDRDLVFEVDGMDFVELRKFELDQLKVKEEAEDRQEGQ